MIRTGQDLELIGNTGKRMLLEHRVGYVGVESFLCHRLNCGAKSKTMLKVSVSTAKEVLDGTINTPLPSSASYKVRSLPCRAGRTRAHGGTGEPGDTPQLGNA